MTIHDWVAATPAIAGRAAATSLHPCRRQQGELASGLRVKRTKGEARQ